MITVAFRLDDPSPLSDHALERRLLALFTQYRIPLTIAVIPFTFDHSNSCIAISAENCPHIANARRLQEIEIALHGHSHIHRSPFRTPSSEFYGVPRLKQEELIRQAKDRLEFAFGQGVVGFVPPWNSFDKETTDVVLECGFKYLSAGWLRPKSQSSGLSIIPRTCTLRTVDSALRDANKFSEMNPCIIVVMHPDDFREFRTPPIPGEDAGFTSLSDLASTLANFSQSRGKVRTVLLREMQIILSNSAYWSRADRSWIDVLPSRLKTKIPRTVLFPKSRARVLFQSVLGGCR